MKKKKNGKKKTLPIRPVMRGYRRGGVGQGRSALVHRGEIIMKNPFGK